MPPSVAASAAPAQPVQKRQAAKAAPIAKQDPPKSYDALKLARAVARHETQDCGLSYGASAKRNCFGFRRNNQFLEFSTKEESYQYFADLWERDFQEFPNIRLATAYVCGWTHLRKNGTVPCAGGNPAGWLSSVSQIYASL